MLREALILYIWDIHTRCGYENGVGRWNRLGWDGHIEALGMGITAWTYVRACVLWDGESDRESDRRDCCDRRDGLPPLLL